MLDARLAREIDVLHLIVVKYGDQQRHQRWWRTVAVLHRRLLSMRRRRRLDVRAAHFIQRRLAPAAARAFHGVLAQGAFITLGFALMAALARVYTLLRELAPAPAGGPRAEAAALDGTAGEAAALDDDVGVPVLERESATAATVVTAPNAPTRSTTEHPREPRGSRKHDKKKKQKQKKRDAIDAIFG